MQHRKERQRGESSTGFIHAEAGLAGAGRIRAGGGGLCEAGRGEEINYEGHEIHEGKAGGGGLCEAGGEERGYGSARPGREGSCITQSHPALRDHKGRRGWVGCDKGRREKIALRGGRGGEINYEGHEIHEGKAGGYGSARPEGRGD